MCRGGIHTHSLSYTHTHTHTHTHIHTHTHTHTHNAVAQRPTASRITATTSRPTCLTRHAARSLAVCVCVLSLCSVCERDSVCVPGQTVEQVSRKDSHPITHRPTRRCTANAWSTKKRLTTRVQVRMNSLPAPSSLRSSPRPLSSSPFLPFPADAPTLSLTVRTYALVHAHPRTHCRHSSLSL